MSTDAYRDQIARYARLLNIRAVVCDESSDVLELTVTRLPARILVQFGTRVNPLLGKGMEVGVAEFVIHVALTQEMVRPFVERSRDITTCWGVAVQVRDAPTAMTNLDPRAGYHAELRITLPARAVDLEAFAWIINQLVCAYIDLMGVRLPTTRSELS